MEFLSLIFYSYLLFNVQLLVREVGATITWTKPSPQRGPLNIGDSTVRTTTKGFVYGSSELHLMWDFTLDGEVLDRVSWELDGVPIGRKTAAGAVTIFPNFEDFNISRSDPATLIVYNVTAADGVKFTCDVETNVKRWKDIIEVVIYVQVKITDQVSGDQEVPEGKSLHLFCGASGKPTPNITWTKQLEDGSMSKVLHRGPTWNFTNINTTDSGTYLCTADNGFGNAVSGQAVKVIVTAPVKIVHFQSEHYVAVQGSVTLHCEAKGNPPPTYSWTPCVPGQVCDNSTLVISQVLNDGVYTCKVTNEFSNDANDTSVFIGGKVINITLIITSEGCTDGKYNESSLLKRLSDTMKAAFPSRLGYESTQLRSVRCGSITVDLALKFNSTTKEQDVISTLRNAVVNGKLGAFSVNPSSIKGTRPDVEKTTVTAPTTPASPSNKTLVIVLAVLGTVIILLSVTGCICWYKYIYKKKKCKGFKDPRVHCNEGQERTMEGDQEGQEGGYALVDRTYADVGPNANYRASNPSSVPPVTYEVAEKSARKGGTQRQEQALPDYAVVDKTKKKKRAPKPGELQYADLAEFSGRETKTTMPRSSATDTVYADIKQ